MNFDREVPKLDTYFVVMITKMRKTWILFKFVSNCRKLAEFSMKGSGATMSVNRLVSLHSASLHFRVERSNRTPMEIFRLPCLIHYDSNEVLFIYV